MKKIFTMLLALVLCAFTSKVVAQTTYYTPGERTTTLEAGKKYFISVATWYNGDACTNLLRNNGGTLAKSDKLPDAVVYDEAFLFTVEEVGEGYLAYIKNSDSKYIQADNLASTETKTGVYVIPYYTGKAVCCGNDVDACDEDGNKIAYADIDDDTPIVTVQKNSDYTISENRNGWRYIGGLSAGVNWCTAFAFYEAKEVADPFEVTTDESNPIYYTIKNVRGNAYAEYDGASRAMLLKSSVTSAANLFYFTAGTEAGTYKIHNAATSNNCAATNSWTVDGIDWYIKVSGNTSYSGYAIANQETLTDGGETNEAWNDFQNTHTSIATYGGNDAGSVWAIEKYTAEVPAIKMSTESEKHLYFIKNDRVNKFANYVKSGSVFTETSASNYGSYWYFVEKTDAENVPEGFKACYIYNAANDKPVQNHSNGYMSAVDDAIYPAKVYLVGAHESTYWGYVIYPQGDTSGWNDQAGQSVTNWDYNTDGSIWSIFSADKTETQLKAEAAAAKTDALNAIANYEHADYYTYADEAIATAKGTIEGVNTNDLASAVSALLNSTFESAITTLTASEKGTAAPAAGEYIQLRNRKDGKYLKANDSDAENSDDAKDWATIWVVEAGEDGNVKLKNLSTEDYIGQIRQSTTVSMTADAPSQIAFTNQTDAYAVFKDVSGADYAYGHVNGGKLVGWEPNAEATQWLVSQVYPLTIVYQFNGKDLADLTINTFVKFGDTYSIMNPYPYKYVTVGSCMVGETPLGAVDGNWTVTVTEPTTVTVTLEESLPFKTSTDENFLIWHYLQVNSSSWKYVTKTDGGTSSTTSVEQLDDKAQWAFVGDAINGFKILNKDTDYLNYSLSVDATTNGTAAYMKQEEKTWQIERGNGGFVIRQGETECLNDFGSAGVLKVWNNANAPAGNGSAFRALEFGVADLSELVNPMGMSVYALQAERSPLMYSTMETTKLSSGLFEQLSENANDVNQQFVILRTKATPEGYFYLYSVGAKKFVDENLNFTDYPSPVLSFESSNHKVYPWWVKIDEKYVIPANTGTDGNKLYHIEGGDNDDGKRYRIVYVGSYSDYSLLADIEQAEDMIKDASELSNEKVYTVSTYERGYWCHNDGKTALWSTVNADKEPASNDPAQQFAFLTVADHTYLYSIGAQKFVVKEGDYTTYSDVPSQSIELLAATGNRFYPFVAAFVNGESKHHIGISNSYEPPVISFYNDLGDGGNKIKIREVTAGYMADGAAELLANAVATIDSYLVAQELKPELLALINRANELLGLGYLDAEDTGALTNAKTTAQGVYDNDAATSGQLTEQVELLTEAITAVTYVREVADFKNAYVYTFVSKRGWMGADGTDGVISGTGAADNTNYQWAVYKSERGYSYLYNIGKAQFMGVETRNNTQMPFSATPQTTGLTFKKSAWTDYPIMFSMDNQYVVNNNKAGKMICWTGGWNNLEDDGSNHQVAIVGALAEETLTTIAEAVNRYEAIQALETAIAAAQAKVDEMSDAIGYYSSSIDNVDTKLEAIVAFKEGITESTTVPEIEEQTVAAEEIAASFSLNLPEAGKFYRFSYDYGDAGVKYVQAVASGVENKTNGMVMTEEQGAASIFYYADGKLLSYSAGQYVRDENSYRGLQDVDAAAGAASFTASTVLGKLYIFAGASFHANKSNDVYFVDHCGSGHNPEHNFTVEEVTELPVTVSAVGYATFYTPVAVTIPGTVTAYVISETATNSVVLKEVTGVVPAGTGLILEGGEGVHTFAIATEGIPAEFDKGLLQGSTAKTYVTAVANTTYYVLAKPAGAADVGLYKAKLDKNKAFLNGANKVYLPVEVAAQAAPAMFSFRRGGGTTGIGELESTANGQQPTAVYDLAGRRVLNPTKGMYIVNGKKVVIK